MVQKVCSGKWYVSPQRMLQLSKQLQCYKRAIFVLQTNLDLSRLSALGEGKTHKLSTSHVPHHQILQLQTDSLLHVESQRVRVWCKEE